MSYFYFLRLLDRIIKNVNPSESEIIEAEKIFKKIPTVNHILQTFFIFKLAIYIYIDGINCG